MADIDVLADQIADAWRANCRFNRMVIDGASPAGWLATLSKRGGRGVAGEFAHCHNIRLAHLDKRSERLAKGIVKLDAGSEPSKSTVLEAFGASDAAVEKLLVGIARGDPACRGFKRGVFTTLSYFVSHEAHHRGRALLTMKVTGNTIDRTVAMNLWAWDKV